VSIRTELAFPCAISSLSTAELFESEQELLIPLEVGSIDAFLSESLVEGGIGEGAIYGRIVGKALHVVFTFLSSRIPDESLVKQLIDEVHIQVVDGICEGGMIALIGDDEWVFEILDANQVSVSFAEDSRSIPRTPRVAIAAKRNDINVLGRACQDDHSSLDLPFQGSPALHHAIANRNMDAIKILLSSGASTEVRDVIGQTPLIFCATNRFLSDEHSVDFANILLQAGANVAAVDSTDRNATTYATLVGKTSLQAFLEKRIA
jgi:hypothetical protein